MAWKAILVRDSLTVAKNHKDYTRFGSYICYPHQKQDARCTSLLHTVITDLCRDHQVLVDDWGAGELQEAVAQQDSLV